MTIPAFDFKIRKDFPILNIGKRLFAGTFPANKQLFAGTLLEFKKLFAEPFQQI